MSWKAHNHGSSSWQMQLLQIPLWLRSQRRPEPLGHTSTWDETEMDEFLKVQGLPTFSTQSSPVRFLSAQGLSKQKLGPLYVLQGSYQDINQNVLVSAVVLAEKRTPLWGLCPFKGVGADGPLAVSNWAEGVSHVGQEPYKPPDPVASLPTASLWSWIRSLLLFGAALLSFSICAVGWMCLLFLLVPHFFAPSTAYQARELYFDYTLPAAVAEVSLLPDRVPTAKVTSSQPFQT
jgi:hypothetical protein